MKQFLSDDKKIVTFLDERFYLIDEKTELYYPSITYILGDYPKGPHYEQWLMDTGNNAKLVRDRAGEGGNKVHNGIYNLFKGNKEEFKYTLEEWRGLLGFQEFYKKYVDKDRKKIVTEFKLESHKYKCACTLDLCCVMMDGKRWIIDYKLSNDIHIQHFIQLAFQRAAWDETFPKDKAEGMGILHLKAKTRGESKGKIQGAGWRLYKPEEFFKKNQRCSYEDLLHQFKSIYDIFHFRNPVLKPKNRIYPTEIKLNFKEAV